MSAALAREQGPLRGALRSAPVVAVLAIVGWGGCGPAQAGSGFSTYGTASGADASAGPGAAPPGPPQGRASGGAVALNLPDASAAPKAPCPADGAAGWKCAVDTSCATPTTLTGRVFDPAGANPLYDVVVFVPDSVASLPAIVPGTHTCNTCDVSIGDYVAATTTDEAGSFTLRGVPTGADVPVTVQIGKWRRTVPVNIPSSCATNPVADGTLRLPARQSEGDMPQMAVLEGGCDDLGCFLLSLGIDPSEFSAPRGGGRLDVYTGVGGATLSSGTAGDCTTSACPLWSSRASLEQYDIVLLSCECAENDQTKPSAARQALHDWLDEGGKVFASHYHYTWFRDSPDADFQGVASWGLSGGADSAQDSTTPYDVDTSFPKGAVFGSWLGLVGALNSPGPPPDILLSPVADSVVSVNPPTTRWIYDSRSSDVKYLSFGTPVGGVPSGPDSGEGPPGYCGKAVFTDLHTSGGGTSPAVTVPAGCPAGGLSPQQEALEFLFFDLAACVSNDSAPPPPPPPPPQ